MIINNATVEQINVVLLDIDKRIKALNADSETLKSLQDSVKLIKSSLNETKAGLTGGATYNINISGNAATATQATTATSAIRASTAESADEAGHAVTANQADSATKDSDNNVISTTYQKKTDMVDYQKVADKNEVAGYVHCDKTADGTYVLEATVVDGVVTYSWNEKTQVNKGEKQ